MTELAASPLRYRPPPEDGRAPKHLAPAPAGEGAPRFTFYGRLEIGRDDGARAPEPGLLLVPDSTISHHHCFVTQRTDGRCFVRDVSRNGTRLEGRRLVPNVETEWRPGQAIAIGAGHAFVLLGAEAPAVSSDPFLTVPRPEQRIATVLVGDIRDYTVLVRTAPAEDLQRSVKAIFDALGAAVVAHGGAVKEYQGDAVLAYWEGDVLGRQARDACRAALALDALAQRLASDPAAWRVGAPLAMEWALATGVVLIDSIGRNERAGLSMMGEPVVRAFRLEKLASAETGRILVCPATHALAEERFDFRDVGELAAKGFDRPERVFALLAERPGARAG